MDFINQISSHNPHIAETALKANKSTNTKKTSDTKADIKDEATLETTQNSKLKANTYKPDMQKIQAMKDETDRRLHDLFKETVKGGTLKQLGGYRGFLERILNGEKVETESGEEITFTDEDIAQAKEDVAEGGYWSAEETANRFIDFAKALSGGNEKKADLLIDAFKEGYKQAEEMWGGELPSLSQDTYDLTMEKFDEWKNGSDTENSTEPE